jgi:hypothetical protein
MGHPPTFTPLPTGGAPPPRPPPPTMGDVVAWLAAQPDPALSRSRLPPDAPADVLGRLTVQWWAIRTLEGSAGDGYECDGHGCALPTCYVPLVDFDRPPRRDAPAP